MRYSVGMSTAILLSDLVDEYEASLRANAYAANTIRNHVRAARLLLAQVGNIQARYVTPRHIDQFFASRKALNLSAGSLNVELGGLRTLFRHATQRRYIAAGCDPTAHRRSFREVRRDRLRVPASEFDRLLSCCHHPRDRMIVSLGLYLFLRQSEVRALRVGDVDLHHGVVTVRIQKTKELDHMPISAELDMELRRWLTFYAQEIGRPLRPDDYLTPAKTGPRFVVGVSRQENLEHWGEMAVLIPGSPVRRPEIPVQTALSDAGYPLRDENDKSLSEGVHTLRRSGARALFDELVKNGYDGAMRTVQSMLHHKSMQTTERYLGLHLDSLRRDDVVRGRRMFTVDRGNIITMENARGNEAYLSQAL